jgi:hypothetical protein
VSLGQTLLFTRDCNASRMAAFRARDAECFMLHASRGVSADAIQYPCVSLGRRGTCSWASGRECVMWDKGRSWCPMPRIQVCQGAYFPEGMQ